MSASIFAITERKEDLEFCQLVASSYRLAFHHASKKDDVRAFLEKNPFSVVYWDVDHAKAGMDADPTSAKSIGPVLLKLAKSALVVAVSERPINELTYLFDIPAFNHHIYRRHAEPAPSIYAKIARVHLMTNPFGAAQY